MAILDGRNGMTDEDDDDDEFVFEEEGDAEIDDPPHHRAIADAAHKGDVDALRLALDNHTGSIDDPVEDGDTALHLSCLYGHLACVQLLLERGASLEIKDEEGALPLHDACAGGYTEIIRCILDSLAGDVDAVKRIVGATDIEGDTPLHHAARGEHVVAVKMLLEAGASASKRNMYGKTPAALADPDTEARTVLEAVATSEGADE